MQATPPPPQQPINLFNHRIDMDQATRASNLLDKDKFKSLRQAAQSTGVAKSTLSDRRAGRNPQSHQRQPHARLEPEQADVLEQYIIDAQLHMRLLIQLN
jgi:hypothetical protein